jgi:hypothetical protein
MKQLSARDFVWLNEIFKAYDRYARFMIQGIVIARREAAKQSSFASVAAWIAPLRSQ